MQMINSPDLVPEEKSLCSLKDQLCETACCLSSCLRRTISYLPRSPCCAHEWTQCGATLVRRCFAETSQGYEMWRALCSPSPFCETKQPWYLHDRDWTGNANLFFKQLRFPFFNRVSIYWINGVNGRLTTFCLKRFETWKKILLHITSLGIWYSRKNITTHHFLRYVI